MRLEGWEERMAQAIAWHDAMVFAWGASDCFTLPMDVVVALIGDDPLFDARYYYSATEAARVLKDRGFSKVDELFASVFEEIHPSLARRGDIGVADYPGALMGGGVVVIGADVIGKGENGTVRLKRSALVRAFKVGW